MDIELHPQWKSQLSEEIGKPYFKALIEFVKSEYRNKICYPPEPLIFSALNMCLFNDVKVVILGQDPYHGPGQANGLCFSVKDGIGIPPSLRNIFKEIETDLSVPNPKTGNLERWANQGVLLLNASLTVVAHNAGSHQKIGWEQFTNAIIKIISDHKSDVVFLLWGGYAKKKLSLIDQTKHSVLTSSHPSPLSANRGLWFGNKHFSKTNFLLEKVGLAPIQW